MASIHPTAIVDSRAELADGVSIGAYCIVNGPIKIGAGTVIHAHTHLGGPTTIGEKCEIGPTAFVGLSPQHLKANKDVGQLIVGNNVTIRETTTVHRAIHPGEEKATRIGDNCFIMGGVHVAHDCVLEDHVILANGALLGGHCRIYTHAFLGGGCALHQFVRVGRLAIIGGNERITQEVPPFAAVSDGGMRGYNAIGCKRAGMSRESINAIRSAYRAIHFHRTKAQYLKDIAANVPNTFEIQQLVEFINTSKRGIVPSVGGLRRVFHELEEKPAEPAE